MHKIIIAGCGTDVGKTVVSAIVTTLFKGDYWKPVQCGHEKNSDTETMKKLLCLENHQVFNSAYSFKASVSPHHAARLENTTIDKQIITLPQTSRPLIIESIGGVYVPLTTSELTIEPFKTWNCTWIIVSKNYIGSINHTLLTIGALKQHNISIAGIIFNGEPNDDSESAILKISKLPFLARLLPEETINQSTIQRYATQWLPLFSHLIH